MTELPIPVERFDFHHSATTLACTAGCGFERDANDNEIRQAEVWVNCACGAALDWKYAEADKCLGCGKLGWWHSAYKDNTCSRVCHLQAEYAKSLEAA